MRSTLAVLVMGCAGHAQVDDAAILAQQQKEVRDLVAKVSPGYVFIGGGSGVCISSDGWILTNHHVAGGQKTWKLRFSGGKEVTPGPARRAPPHDRPGPKIPRGEEP